MEIWRNRRRIPCWPHRAKNVLDVVPSSARAEVGVCLGAVRDAPTLKDGWRAAQLFARCYEREYRLAVRRFADDLDAGLASLGARRQWLTLRE